MFNLRNRSSSTDIDFAPRDLPSCCMSLAR
jgi:hypothetical protein